MSSSLVVSVENVGDRLLPYLGFKLILDDDFRGNIWEFVDEGLTGTLGIP